MLPEDDAELIRAFAWWTQSGTFIAPTGVAIEPEELWILGDKLVAPKFCNAAMLQLMQENYWEYRNRDADQADYIWNQLPRVTKLHEYLTELVFKGGPWDTIDEARYADNLTLFEERWLELLRQGRPQADDEMTETIRGGHWNHPAKSENKRKYFEDEVVYYHLQRSSRFNPDPVSFQIGLAWSSRPTVDNPPNGTFGV
jgi:hypothetical protein